MENRTDAINGTPRGLELSQPETGKFPDADVTAPASTAHFVNKKFLVKVKCFAVTSFLLLIVNVALTIVNLRNNNEMHSIHGALRDSNGNTVATTQAKTVISDLEVAVDSNNRRLFTGRRLYPVDHPRMLTVVNSATATQVGTIGCKTAQDAIDNLKNGVDTATVQLMPIDSDDEGARESVNINANRYFVDEDSFGLGPIKAETGKTGASYFVECSTSTCLDMSNKCFVFYSAHNGFDPTPQEKSRKESREKKRNKNPKKQKPKKPKKSKKSENSSNGKTSKGGGKGGRRLGEEGDWIYGCYFAPNSYKIMGYDEDLAYTNVVTQGNTGEGKGVNCTPGGPSESTRGSCTNGLCMCYTDIQMGSWGNYKYVRLQN